MYNYDVVNIALSTLSQSTGVGSNPDYEERASYLLASFCQEMSELDNTMRKLLGLETHEPLDTVCLDLEEIFPLLDRFISVAAKYLAAMLVIDENPELSDRLFAIYCDAMTALRSELPYSIEKIANRYFK